MLGSARRLAALHAGIIVTLLVPAAALAAKPSSPGGGKKSQSLWSNSYTYKNCYEADMAGALDPGAITRWQPSVPDATGLVTLDEDDGDSPHAGSIASTGLRITTGPVFEALPQVLRADYWGANRFPAECTGAASASRDTGALAVSSRWAAQEVAPTYEGGSTAGAGVTKLVQLRDSVSSLKVTAVFTTAADKKLEANKTGGGYADVLGSLFVRPPNCDSPCPSQSDYIVLARDNAQGSAAVAPGDQRVVLTLRALDGQKLPRGYYHVTQLLSTWTDNFRLPDQSSAAAAEVTAKALTVTTTP